MSLLLRNDFKPKHVRQLVKEAAVPREYRRILENKLLWQGEALAAEHKAWKNYHSAMSNPYVTKSELARTSAKLNVAEERLKVVEEELNQTLRNLPPLTVQRITEGAHRLVDKTITRCQKVFDSFLKVAIGTSVILIGVGATRAEGHNIWEVAAVISVLAGAALLAIWVASGVLDETIKMASNLNETIGTLNRRIGSSMSASQE